MSVVEFMPFTRNFYLARLAKSIKNALADCKDEVPCFIVSYNNGVYVENMVRQFSERGICPIVIDNRSTDAGTLQTLRSLNLQGVAKVVFSEKNFGHQVGFFQPVYDALPEVFAYTDPDLGFNGRLPEDFLSVLSDLTVRYSVYKAGFALQLLDDEPGVAAKVTQSVIRPFRFEKRYSFAEWESQFWRKRLDHPSLSVYAAPIDTTFSVYRKSNFNGDFSDAVRVAGDFAAIHLPWYPRLDLFSDKARGEYLKRNSSSTWRKPD